MKIEKADLNQILDRAIGWIENCDTKASIILGGLGVAVSVLCSFDYVEKIITLLKNKIDNFTFCNLIYFVLAVSSMGAIIIGGYYLVRVLIARTNTKEFASRGIKSGSVLFFSTIAGNATYQIYKEKLGKIDASEYDADITSQIYICAIVCQRKFENYKKGLVCSVGGFALFILMIIIGIIS